VSFCAFILRGSGYAALLLAAFGHFLQTRATLTATDSIFPGLEHWFGRNMPGLKV